LARFTFSDSRTTQLIQKSGLAVVDMSEYYYDRLTQNQDTHVS